MCVHVPCRAWTLPILLGRSGLGPGACELGYVTLLRVLNGKPFRMDCQWTGVLLCSVCSIACLPALWMPLDTLLHAGSDGKPYECFMSHNIPGLRCTRLVADAEFLQQLQHMQQRVQRVGPAAACAEWDRAHPDAIRALSAAAFCWQPREEKEVPPALFRTACFGMSPLSPSQSATEGAAPVPADRDVERGAGVCPLFRVLGRRQQPTRCLPAVVLSAEEQPPGHGHPQLRQFRGRGGRGSLPLIKRRKKEIIFIDLDPFITKMRINRFSEQMKREQTGHHSDVIGIFSLPFLV